MTNDLVATLDATLREMLAAAERARTANHHAYTAPRTPASVYDRVGALYDLLGRTQQLAEVLVDHSIQMLEDDSLFADDAQSPGVHVTLANRWLGIAAGQIADAAGNVNRAWSSISHLGARDS